LIPSLAKGVLGGDLRWDLIGLGALIGVAAIIVDEVLARTTKKRLPPLAVGMGVYLPMSLTLLVPVGARNGRGERMTIRTVGELRRRGWRHLLVAVGATSAGDGGCAGSRASFDRSPTVRVYAMALTASQRRVPQRGSTPGPGRAHISARRRTPG